MLESLNTSWDMQYQKLSPEEQSARGILGRLTGVVADFKNPTRNGRLYTEALWEKTFNNPIMQEKLKNKCLFGELGHPADRSEIDMEKIAICMAEQPKKGKDGKLYSVFDILSTPNGRILKTLCDYGCNIGVSSRGTGDTYMGPGGQETVDEDSYECECWDAVLIPSVKSARMKYVTESLDTKTLKKALQESLSKENDDDRKVAESTLESLGIDYKDSSEKEEEKLVNDKQEVAENNGTDIVEQLQEVLKENQTLQKKILSLQEKLSVSYTKEIKNEEKIADLNNQVRQLSESVRGMKKLEARLNATSIQLVEAKKSLEAQTSSYNLLKERYYSAKEKNKSLIEDNNSSISKIKLLEENLSNLKVSIQEKIDVRDNKIKSLTEELTQLKQDSSIKNSRYTKTLNEYKNKVNTLNSKLNESFDKYIESKASSIGVTANEIKNKLNESYSFKDIDKVCENLIDYKLNISKLPFNLNGPNISKIALNESLSSTKTTNPDDIVDKNLLNMI